MAGAAGGFVTRAFEAMQKECATNKKFAPLQKSIQSYLDDIKRIKQEPPATDASVKTENEGDSNSAENEPKQVENVISITETLASAGNTLEGSQAELVLQPLRLAFESKNIKLIEPALDCLHKLIAYDHLEGDPGLEGGKNAPLLTDILNMVCGCVDNTTLDSTILQVLKVLLTAVASNKFRVHGEPLQAVIRVCYNIALNSKSPINQATSKAMLTQMISIIFRRMESDQVPVAATDEASNSGEKNQNDSESKEISVVEEEKELKEEVTTLGDALSISNVTEATPTSVEELQNLAGGADIKGLEAVLDKAVQLEDGKKVTRGIDLESMSIAHRDALLLFRTLCKMGMKEETDEVTTKTRLLSLELLQGLLEGVSGSFTKNFHFIDSVKAYLSYALLRASVSSSPLVSQYASGIFSVLLLRFRESLKGEIGVFFPLIVIRSLDSSDTPLTQRASVLRMLEKVCKDSQMLADLFVNYDCDLEAPNLYERMVNALSKIAQGTISADPNSVTATQANTIKGSSLQCLVSIIKSLVDWEKAKREATKQSSVAQSLENEDASSTKDRSIEEMKSREEGLSHFEKAKAHKSTLEAAVSEFNRKPSKGIEYLVSNKLVENTPSSVAQFLKTTPTLNKVMIGEYLGQHEEFPLAVMHAYVESMKFSGLKFDSAIREFLKGFRLPGEAQKIDRIMEKFAERYCADNPGLFKNADTAYVLAYAVIMLNTDAHNPMVWPKMSKSDFIRINTVSDAEENAPKELLEEIYDSIIQQEIKIKDSEYPPSSKGRVEERGGIVNILNLALPRSKSGTDTKAESERIVKQTQAIIKSQGGKRGVFYTAEQVELVRPMLEAVGWPLLATFSVTMEEGDSKPRVLLCMEGFKAGIHITRVLGMDTMRYAFLTSLIRFTFLHAPKQLRSKNAEALKTLLALADTETDALQDTWNAVLECVSRLEHITAHPSVTQTVMQGSNQISRDSVVQALKELAGRPSEQVFVNSVKLPSNTIVEFFTALCSVSNEELKQTPARVFSLQKLVEISYYNMARIRMVWAQIWTVLARHFITAGSHPDEKVAMYAIDSLRQLGMKYLERAELNKFTFQNDILKPFVVLMRNSRNDKIRGLIVDCIVQLIKSKVGSIKSGWKSVFMIFTAASDDDMEPIVESAFENVEQVILEHFDQVVGDCFMDCVNCLIGFANNKTSPRISLKAIALLRICEDRLAEGFIPGGALKPVDISSEETNFDITEYYWFPMLAGLSDLTLDPRPEVRSCALEVLFDLLNERGQKFSSAFWESIFQRVLFPIFDHVRHAGRDGLVSSSGEDWLRETSIHSLQLVCNLFNTFYNEVSFMLPPLLGLLLDCAKKTDQTVVSIALGALVHLIEVGGHRFSDADWDTLLKSIRDALYTTQPLELLNSVGFEKPKSNSDGADVGNSDAETTEININSNSPHSYQETIENSEGLPSPSAKTPTGATSSPRNPSFSQRFMDNLLLRNLTSKSRVQAEETLASSSQQELEEAEGDKTGEEEEEVSPIMETVRSKCITQLLLLGAINCIQVKYWTKLKAPQKIAIMDVLMSLLEFAASYNSPSNLRIRMHHMSSERPPLNLLRQEISGTTIYLEILHKSTTEANSDDGLESEYEKIKGLAEEKLVTFCNNVLKEASDLQPSSGEASGFDIHRVLSLRSPIIVKVLKGMCHMDADIFKRHLRDFYPLITKLICCDQMDVRGALGDLFTTQLTGLMPKPDASNAVHAY